MDRDEKDRDRQDGRRLLAPLRGAEPGPGGVDIAEALRAGRHRARARRAGGVTLAAGVVAAVAVASTMLGRAMPPDRQQRPVAPPTQFELTRQFFRVGSAGGFAPDTYETGRYRQRVHLVVSDPASNRRADGVIMLYPRDRLTGADGQRWAPSGPKAPPVHDRPAVYLDRPIVRAGAVEVAWEWAPGAWAIASLKGDGVDREVAQRTAQSVLPDGNATVMPPVSVPPSLLGNGNRLIGTVSREPRTGVRALRALRYGPEDPAAQLPAAEPGWIDVGVEEPDPGLNTDIEIDGRPAAERGTRVTVPDADHDAALFAEASGTGVLDTLGGRTGLRRLAAAVTLVPGRNWPPTAAPSSACPTTGGTGAGSAGCNGPPN
ncbi:hypothetical protein [Actinomadura hibisca]|uniref:hypothetical protein n=1 Tax=Actinomadura hibisca TaxID=68565 RepID=UPI000836E32C|nr:hypothetical protein [Actinomadura hibisca]